MALIPQGSIELGFPDQTKLYFEDITGAYNASTNVGGYGAPNTAKASITKTTLKLTAPGTTTPIIIDPWDYLPTDTEQAEITCAMYDSSLEIDEVVVEDDCNNCPDDILLTDCNEDPPTCFGDGCWTFEYSVFTGVVPTLVATTVFTQFFYMQVLAQLMNLQGLIDSGAVTTHPNWNWQGEINMAWNNYSSMLLTSQLKDCDCNCVTSKLAKLQRKLTEMTNKV